MPSPKQPLEEAAALLVTTYGRLAPQRVVDQIIICIREHDIQAAKAWEEVGRRVDRELEYPRQIDTVS